MAFNYSRFNFLCTQIKQNHDILIIPIQILQLIALCTGNKHAYIHVQDCIFKKNLKHQSIQNSVKSNSNHITECQDHSIKVNRLCLPFFVKILNAKVLVPEKHMIYVLTE